MVDLLMFYGTECVHCHDMDPLVAKLKKEEKLDVEKLEVWHNSKNKKLYDKYNKTGAGIRCTGVPYFYNKKSKEFICGAVDYEEFKEWAVGK